MVITFKQFAGTAAVVGSLTLFSIPAFAQRAVIDTGGDDPYAPDTMTPYGISVTGGGGVTGFLRSEARDYTSTGGNWNARVALGTRYIVAAELGYVGSAQSVNALGLDSDANLMSNGAEVAARLNILPGAVQPYLLAGAGFTHYRIVGEDFNNSNLENSDNVAHFPLAAGLALRYRGFVADARGTVRPVADDTLLAGAQMHTWGVNLNAGVEF